MARTIWLYVGYYSSVVKSFESEDATILPKSATKGATPEICKKAPSKIFDDVFFLEKKFGAKKAPKLGAKAPQFLPPQPFLWIIFFRYQVLVFFLLKNFKRECVTKNTSFCDFVWLDWYLPTIVQWGHFAKKVERHNFLRRPSESINEVNFLV